MSVEKFPEHVRKLAARLEEKAPARGPVPASSVAPKEMGWLWYPRIPAGMMTILGGKGARCKGQVCASLAASVSTHGAFPDGEPYAEKGHVLWCEAEDPLPEVVIPRLIAAGADLDRVDVIRVQDFREYFARTKDLARYLRENETRLIVMSPMRSFLNGLANGNDDEAVRRVLEEVQESIEGTKCGLVGIGHLNKKVDLDAVERLLGSVAFVNFVRSVMLVEYDPESSEEDPFFRLKLEKHNCATGADDLTYRSVNVGENPRSQYVKLEWEKPEGGNISTDKLFERRKSDDKLSAGDWLVNYLQEYGDTPHEIVVDAGMRAGYSQSALMKAQTRGKRVRSYKSGFQGPSMWTCQPSPKKDK
jgi:putative DNA primase/helicase